MPSAKPTIKKQRSPKRCYHCTNKAKSRGCCDTCRIAIFARIRRGEFTEQQAIKDGWIDEPKHRGPKPKNGFAAKYQQSLKRR